VILLSTQNGEARKGKMTVVEAGRKGGQKTASTHGREFYEKIGRRGGEKVSSERGSEFFSEIGRKGGENRGNKTAGTKGGSNQQRRSQLSQHDKELT
jgi:uncharacterized protein